MATTKLPLDKIICGDNVETMRTFPSDCIDLVVTSPPYDNLRTYGGGTWNFKQVAAELWRLVKPGGVVVWVVADETVDGSETGTSFRQALHFKDIGFRLHDTMIWDKGGFSAVGAVQIRYGPSSEYMFIFSNGKPSTFNPIRDRRNIHAGTKSKAATVRLPNGSIKRQTHKSKLSGPLGIRFNVWNIPSECSNTRRWHPAPFPLRLAGDHIVSWSNFSDIVLDPFNGSGTTTEAAYRMHRHYIGIDIAAEYCDIARARLAQKVLPIGDGDN